MAWKHTVRLKHLLTEDESPEAVRAAMRAIADVLDESPCFIGFPRARFRAIPDGDEVVRPVDYANRLLDRMYGFADARRIWIE